MAIVDARGRRRGRFSKSGAPSNTLPPEEIRRLYWEEGLSSVDIAPRYHVTPFTIRAFMRRHAIPVRTKSEARKLHGLH